MFVRLFKVLQVRFLMMLLFKDVPAHPLMNRDAFQIDPARQREHNRSILSLLNNGNLKLLTALPAIGPKTGLIIHGYRELHGGIKDIKVFALFYY